MVRKSSNALSANLFYRVRPIVVRAQHLKLPLRHSRLVRSSRLMLETQVQPNVASAWKLCRLGRVSQCYPACTGSIMIVSALGWASSTLVQSAAVVSCRRTGEKKGITLMFEGTVGRGEVSPIHCITGCEHVALLETAAYRSSETFAGMDCIPTARGDSRAPCLFLSCGSSFGQSFGLVLIR